MNLYWDCFLMMRHELKTNKYGLDKTGEIK